MHKAAHKIWNRLLLLLLSCLMKQSYSLIKLIILSYMKYYQVLLQVIKLNQQINLINLMIILLTRTKLPIRYEIDYYYCYYH